MDTDPDSFYNRPTGWAFYPNRKAIPYPVRILEKKDDMILIAPNNDRGYYGECYWIDENLVDLD